MRRLSLSPDAHTFPFVLKASAQYKSLSLARTLHCQSLKFGFSADVYDVNCLISGYSVTGRIQDACRVFDESPHRDVVSYNALMDGIVKVGETERGREVFNQMPVRDVVSWGTLIAGYAKGDQFKEAIELFDQMIGFGVCPDNIALVSAFSACAQLGELEKGKIIHDHIERKGIQIDGFLSTSLVDLYAKLVQPDGVTFLAVLVGCSHVGLINEARQVFEEMEAVYGVPQELKHYGCMAYSLGRAGLIREAMEMIDDLPMRGDVFVWAVSSVDVGYM
ncbi:pentatricopeptide repeat (PPR) superfamily protein [Actinidia rufa]|uniref:Pentatricopeptide repeat (PPR) superfamily protein n=1 Tax=Actinidia rufa TaxID=165716 RepID=A0A7J0FZ43_9ERIC|nr:pentatricopeptide repeat (PPR) superfamily protein [Actinidia rufa]